MPAETAISSESAERESQRNEVTLTSEITEAAEATTEITTAVAAYTTDEVTVTAAAVESSGVAPEGVEAAAIDRSLAAGGNQSLAEGAATVDRSLAAEEEVSAEEAEAAWQLYAAQYKEWYEAHGRAAGADPTPPRPE